MTSKEKQLLLKDLCARVPYGVKFTLPGNCIYTMKGIDLIVTDEGDWDYAVTAKGIAPIEIKYIKPYLRPMSSMTEEEEQSLREWQLNPKNNTFDWLNKNHFDYRGLIPVGLALEALEELYKEE